MRLKHSLWERATSLETSSLSTRQALEVWLVACGHLFIAMELIASSSIRCTVFSYHTVEFNNANTPSVNVNATDLMYRYGSVLLHILAWITCQTASLLRPIRPQLPDSSTSECTWTTLKFRIRLITVCYREVFDTAFQKLDWLQTCSWIPSWLRSDVGTTMLSR